MEMPQLLGLSYQVILPSKRRRILLANCPQEAESVNSRVMPCNAVPSGWPLCQCWGTLRGMLQFSGKAFWCVLSTATILWTVNSVLNTSTMCHVCMLFSLRVSLVGLYRWTLYLIGKLLLQRLSPETSSKKISVGMGRGLTTWRFVWEIYAKRILKRKNLRQSCAYFTIWW